MAAERLQEPGVCRVFLSSPFKGMEKERDEFTKRYWPQIDQFCKSRGVQFVPVDMRWGITEERQQSHQTIQICLREIDRSDIFVGFYAQRYGWHGTEEETLQKNINVACQVYPWVDRFRNRSVTELEFLHGHLNNPGEKPAIMCFRNKEYDALCKANAIAERDSCTAKNYSVESEKAAKSMENLKKRVKETESQCLAMSMAYDTPEEGAKLIFDSLWKYLTETLLKDKADRCQLEQESISQRAECKTDSTTFVANEFLLKKLDSHLLKDSGILLVTGGRGSGKTTLLGNWILQQTTKDNISLVYHFCNCTSESASVQNILVRLVTSLQYELLESTKTADNSSILWKELEDTYSPMDEGKLTSVWWQLMDHYSQKRKKVLIIIAGLDKITYRGREKIVQILHWLPKSLPKGCYLVVSTHSGDKRHLDCIREKVQHNELTMEPLSLKQKFEISKKLLGLRGKELTEKQTKAIVDATATSNPLFLTTALEELCVFSDFRGLDSKIHSLIACKSSGQLFDKYLERLETDYDQSTVRRVTCALYASRLGLQETELIEMFDIPQTEWLPLYYGLREFLILRRGFLRIAYYDLEQAVFRRYVKNEEKRKKIIEELLAYYMSVIERHIGKTLPPHLLKEVLWASFETDNRHVMETILTTPAYFKHFIETGQSAYVFEYLQWLGYDEKSIVYLYHKRFDSKSEKDSDSINDVVENLWTLYDFLVFAQFLTAQEKTLMALTAIVETNPKLNLLKHKLKVYMYLSQTLAEQMKIDASLEMCKKFMDLLPKNDDSISIEILKMKAKVCHTIGLMSIQKEAFADAEYMLRNSMVLNRRLGHRKAELMNIKQSQKLLAEIQFKMGKYKESSEMYEEVIDFEEKLAGGEISLEMSNTYIALSQCYRKMNLFDKAEQCLEKALKIKTGVLGENHRDIAITLFNMANLCEDRNDKKGMIDYLRRAIEIHKFLGEDACNSHNLLLCYDNLIMALIKCGSKVEATKIYFSIFSAIQAKFDSVFASNHDAIFRHACEYEKGQEAIKIMKCLSVSKCATPEHFIMFQRLVERRVVTEDEITDEMTIDAALQRFPESGELIIAKAERDLVPTHDENAIKSLLEKRFQHTQEDQERVVCECADLCEQWREGALGILEEWREKLDEKEYILRKLAMLYYEAEELKKAAQCFKEAIAVNSSDWQLYDKLVLMLLMQGQVQEANNELKTMKDKFKNDHHAMAKAKTYELQMEQMKAHVQRRLSNKS